ncbi:ABC transporter permease subunit [Shinella sp. CPCC 100929]|uniref:ABC transporter permease subunit n=1 Tax=Shinella lacus TaxID=2654216 RepID=A0ABT1R1E3_9HYPH|nr:ABC transporter permease subunit [Shinella lacus]MCQ4628982.1 ABC transporter permease subunit [Shinella lacus]
MHEAQSAVPIARKPRLRWDREVLLKVIYAATLVLVVLLVMTPLAALIYGSFRSSAPGVEGDWTIANYANLASANLLSTIWLTLLVGVLSAVFCVVIGTAMALIIHRTDFAYKNIITALIGLAFYFPAFILAMAWIILGSPGGLINFLFRDVLGITDGVKIYSVAGIVFVTILHQVPFVYLLMRGPIISMDGVFEEAARAAGARSHHVLFRITLPLLSYSLLSSLILTFVLAIEQFAIPAMLGLPGHITLLPTQIYLLVRFPPTDYGLAAAVGLTLAALTSLAILAQRRVTRAGRMATVTGKAGHLRTLPLGRWRWAANTFCFGFVFLSLILPSLILIYMSVIKWYVSNPFLAQYTLRNYEFIWNSADAHKSIWNTLIVSGVGGIFGVALAFLTSYFTVRLKPPSYRLLDFTASLPFGVPGMVMALGFLWAYAYLPLPFYGTLALIIVAFITRYLPYATEAIGGQLVQIDKSLEEAAWVGGATKLGGLRRILLPLSLPSIQGAYFLLFMAFFREMSSVVLLFTSNSKVISISIWGFFEGADWGLASSFSVLTTLIIFGVIWLIVWLMPAARRV